MTTALRLHALARHWRQVADVPVAVALAHRPGRSAWAVTARRWPGGRECDVALERTAWAALRAAEEMDPELVAAAVWGEA